MVRPKRREYLVTKPSKQTGRDCVPRKGGRVVGKTGECRETVGAAKVKLPENCTVTDVGQLLSLCLLPQHLL